MKCQVCEKESGKYSFCRLCYEKKERGSIAKCNKCNSWHDLKQPCFSGIGLKNHDQYLYELKFALISNKEKAFFEAIKTVLPDRYFVFPQINLAAFINKTNNSYYRSELFRNVDFLITDSEYVPRIVIEINDKTHFSSDRRKRDEKVQNICDEAGIPVIKLWTSYGINEEYIKRRISETLSSPMQRIHRFSNISEVTQSVNATTEYNSSSKNKKGCYIATCVYGSYDCPQVCILRRYRDNTLATTWYGKVFIHVYYTISPMIVKLFGNKKWFIKLCKSRLDKWVKKLQDQGIESAPYRDN